MTTHEDTAENASPDGAERTVVMGTTEIPVTIYRSRPQVVEAVQWTGSNFPQLKALFGDKVRLPSGMATGNGALRLLAGKHGAQEWVPVPIWHWLVNQVDDLSDIWPVDNGYFQEKYERA